MHQNQYQHYWTRVQPSGLPEFLTLQIIDYNGNLLKDFDYLFNIIINDFTGNAWLSGTYSIGLAAYGVHYQHLWPRLDFARMRLPTR